MATTTNLEPNRGWAQHTGSTHGRRDRVRRLTRARRHTSVVYFLRWSLPALAAGVVCLYVAMVLETIGWVQGLPQMAIPTIIPKNLTMDNPRYEGFNKDGGSYVVTAKTAIQSLVDLSQIKLNGINGDLTDANKAKTNLKAAHGLYNSKTKLLELFDGIDIVSQDGMHARLSRATVFTEKNLVVTKEPVVVDMPAGTIRSKEMTLRNETRQVTFLNDVKAHLIPNKNGKQKPAAAADTPLISAANGPIDITASRLDIDDAKKVATFTGSVRAVQGDATLETAALEVGYESPAGAPAAEARAATIRRIASTSPVVMTRAPQDRVTAKSLDFDAVKEIAVLTGDVVMTSGSDRRVSGHVATIDQKADTVLLTGDVVAVQGRNQLNGERLFVERAAGRTHLSSPATPGSNEPGRITTRFFRGEGKTAQPSTRMQDALGAAAVAGVFKTDPNAPIDVEADHLDVDDRARLAIFKGDVHAKQGDFLVRTAELRAHYSGQAGLAQPAGAGKHAPAQLTHIEASGKVIVNSKGGQSATGDWAEFNVKSNRVTLGGDVILTQENNVVRGTRLVIDMLTGQSLIQNEPTAWTATAAPDRKDGQSDSGTGFVVKGPTSHVRPSAIFYPRAKKNQSKDAPTPTTESPSGSDTGSGWDPTKAGP